MPEIAPGRLLVAAPDLEDPNFQRSVVLVLAHTDEGTLGVALNRTGELPVAEVVPELEGLAAEPASVFVGGPVQPDGVVALAQVDEEVDGVGPVAPGLGVLDLDRETGFIPPEVQQLRLFAGHAGWDAGQLEDELAAGGWFVVDGEPGDAMTDDPEHLWERVLRRQGGVFSTATADPSTN